MPPVDPDSSSRTSASEPAVSFFGCRNRPAPELPVGVTPGQELAGFSLVQLIGQGGMGHVWEAVQLSVDRRVALKLVRPEMVTEKTLDLFAREARAGARFHHPGIVDVFDHGTTEGIAWIAMEYVEGAWTLRDFLNDVAAQEEIPDRYYRDVAAFIVKLADAMQAVHEHGVIHRDLKPQNVLITPEDDPKVTDFGLARITDESAISATGEFAGTYYYMSPEQVAARRSGIDHRTDIFSLGVVMYEMITGRRPFEGDSSHQVADQILVKEAPDMRALRSRIPPNLAVITGKSLEKDRARRYQTMKELASDIQRHLQHEPIIAKPPAVVRRIVLWGIRHPTHSTALTLVALGLAVTLGLLWRLSLAANTLQVRTHELSTTAKDLEKRTEELSASARREWTARSLFLADSSLASTASGDAGTGLALALEALGTDENPEIRPKTVEAANALSHALANLHEVAVLRGHTAPVVYSQFTPDGLSVLTASEDATVRTWAIDGQHRITTKFPGAIRGASLSPEARMLLTYGDRWVCVWEIGTNQAPRQLLSGQGPSSSEVDCRNFKCVAFNDNGSTIAAGCGGGHVHILSLSGEAVATINCTSAVQDVKFAPREVAVFTLEYYSGRCRKWGFSGNEIAQVAEGTQPSTIRSRRNLNMHVRQKDGAVLTTEGSRSFLWGGGAPLDHNSIRAQWGRDRHLCKVQSNRRPRSHRVHGRDSKGLDGRRNTSAHSPGCFCRHTICRLFTGWPEGDRGNSRARTLPLGRTAHRRRYDFEFSGLSSRSSALGFTCIY